MTQQQAWVDGGRWYIGGTNWEAERGRQAANAVIVAQGSDMPHYSDVRSLLDHASRLVARNPLFYLSYIQGLREYLKEWESSGVR